MKWVFLFLIKAQYEQENINRRLRQEERKSFSVILGGFQKSRRYKKQYHQKGCGEKTDSVFKKKHMNDDIDYLRKTEKIQVDKSVFSAHLCCVYPEEKLRYSCRTEKSGTDSRCVPGEHLRKKLLRARCRQILGKEAHRQGY